MVGGGRLADVTYSANFGTSLRILPKATYDAMQIYNSKIGSFTYQIRPQNSVSTTQEACLPGTTFTSGQRFTFFHGNDYKVAAEGVVP